MELFKLFGTIAINNTEANQSIDETTGKASGAQSKIVSSFKKIGAAVVAYLAVDKIIDFGSACINAASDAQAMNSQFAQVFGDLGELAAQNLSGIADSAGITEERMKASYTKIAAFAKTTGMETADALSLADRAMVAVADSAAFYDRTLEETTESLQSFLKGNFENDAALGLSCTETTRNAAANELYGQSFKDLSEAQKQLTLLKMVEDANALSGALGQSARESETWTNQIGNLGQAWTNFKAAIGEGFLDFAVDAVMGLTTVVDGFTARIPVITEQVLDIYNKVSVYFPIIQNLFQNLMNVLNVIWSTIGQPLFNMIKSAVDTVRNTFAQYMPEIREFVSNCFTDIQNFWNNNLKPCLEAIGNFIENVLAPVFEAVFNGYIAPAVETAFKYIQSLWNDVLKPVFIGITDFLTGVFTLNFRQVWDGLVGIVKGAVNGIINGIETLINGAINAINAMIDGLNKLSAIARSLLGIPTLPRIPLISLPRLEKGGILEEGQMGLLEGNGAEAVVPLDQNSAWISAVAKDMQTAGIGGNNQQTQRVVELLEMLVEMLPDTMKDAFASMKFDVNNREFARLVKAVG